METFNPHPIEDLILWTSNEFHTLLGQSPSLIKEKKHTIHEEEITSTTQSDYYIMLKMRGVVDERIHKLVPIRLRQNFQILWMETSFKI